MSENGEHPRGSLESFRERARRFIGEIPTYARQLREALKNPGNPIYPTAFIVLSYPLLSITYGNSLGDLKEGFKEIGQAYGIALVLAVPGALLAAWAIQPKAEASRIEIDRVEDVERNSIEPGVNL